ncbi:hypothetical protein MKW94_008796, partial [Papaver nudicaule]|nr:hypothetical protein [Papaver nudicaule]
MKLIQDLTNKSNKQRINHRRINLIGNIFIMCREFHNQNRISAEMYRGETRSFLGGIDVNKMPSTATATVDCEEDVCGGNGGGMNSDDEDGENSRKKLRLSKDQSAILEETFKEHNTLNP